MRQNIQPEALAKRVVGGNVLYSHVVVVEARKTIPPRPRSRSRRPVRCRLGCTTLPWTGHMRRPGGNSQGRRVRFLARTRFASRDRREREAR